MKHTIKNFRRARDLNGSEFRDHEVWSEFYDYDELQEIRSWGVEERYLDELLEIGKERYSSILFNGCRIGDRSRQAQEPYVIQRVRPAYPGV